MFSILWLCRASHLKKSPCITLPPQETGTSRKRLHLVFWNKNPNAHWFFTKVNIDLQPCKKLDHKEFFNCLNEIGEKKKSRTLDHVKLFWRRVLPHFLLQMVFLHASICLLLFITLLHLSKRSLLLRNQRSTTVNCDLLDRWRSSYC